MSIKIDTANRISLDGKQTGLAVTQAGAGTKVYTPEFMDRKYKEHAMPHTRYSLVHDKPDSGAAGLAQFEADIRNLLTSL